METGLLGSFRAEEEQFSAVDNVHSSFIDAADLISMDNHIVMFPSHETDSEGSGYKNSMIDWPNEILDDCYDGSLVNERLINFGLGMMEQESPYRSLNFNLSDANDNEKYSPDTDCTFAAEEKDVDRDRGLLSEDVLDSSAGYDRLNDFSDNLLEHNSISNLLDSIDENPLDPSFDLLANFDDRPNTKSDIFHSSPVKTAASVKTSPEKFTQASQIHKKYALNSVRTKRKRPKSFSVPHSPERKTVDLELYDLPSSLCFEDLSEVDFNQFVDDDININPEKAFDRALCISDVIDGVAERDGVEAGLDINFDFPGYVDEDMSNILGSADIDYGKISEIVNDVSKSEVCVREEDKSDTDDFIDVENVSDAETSPGIAASNLNSLLNQFEASGDFSKSSRSLTVLKTKKSHKTISHRANCMTNIRIRKIDVEKKITKSLADSAKVKQIKMPSLKTNRENIYLDHDYCHASPIKHPAHLKNQPSKEREVESNNCRSAADKISLLRPKNSSDTHQSLLKPIQKVSPVFEKKNRNACLNLTKTGNKIAEYDHSYSRDNSAVKTKGKKKSLKDSDDVQNVIVFENGTERLIDIKKDCADLFVQSQLKKACDSKLNNNNSILINNLNRPYIESANASNKMQKLTNTKSSSLLRPITDNVKMISLLKSNYCNDELLINDTIKCSYSGKDDIIIENKCAQQPILKKKLNLQEYKTRKDGNALTCNNLKKPKIEVLTKLSSTKEQYDFQSTISKNEVENIENNSTRKIFDPIAEATKKVLRLKRNLAQKYDEDLVMRRIRRVSNSMILPLVVENNDSVPVGETRVDANKKSDYDETIMVSIGINTDLDHSLSYSTDDNSFKNKVNLEPVKDEHFEVSHGEDRVIMHLMKNRTRPIMQSKSTQTNTVTINVEHNLNLPHKHTVLNSQKAIAKSAEQTVVNRAESPVHSADIDKLEQNYIDLINRWRCDPAQNERSSSACRSENSISNASSRISRSRRDLSKYKSKRNRSSDSSNLPKFKAKHERERSNSKNRRKQLNSKSHNKQSSIRRHTAEEMNTAFCYKRKRNLSIKSNDLACNANGDAKSNQPPIKISRDIDNPASSDLYNDQVSSIKDGVLLNDELKIPLHVRHSRRDSESSDCSQRSDSSSDLQSSSSSSTSRSSRSSNARSRSSHYMNRQSRRTHVEERKVIYVGMLEPEITVYELKMKFVKYGCVKTVTFHTKDDGMRYGFVTFAEAQQTYKVLEKAPTDPEISHYDVFFGGRREFCKQTYADLDDIEAMREESEYFPNISRSTVPPAENSFDRLLKETRAALNAKKSKNRF